MVGSDGQWLLPACHRLDITWGGVTAPVPPPQLVDWRQGAG